MLGSRIAMDSQMSLADWLVSQKKVFWTYQILINSLGWFKGKSTGNHGFYHQI
jgi:hypothetical protein